MKGFGNQPFGKFPFGNSDWGLVVLWDELPDSVKQEDLDNGGWYYKFVTALVPSFNEMISLIFGMRKYKVDPATVRMDLLRYIAEKFGVILDYAEPEAYQRTRVEIAGRWRLIKGTEASYKVLCAVHGFDVEVEEIWWTGTSYSGNRPVITNDLIGVTV